VPPAVLTHYITRQVRLQNYQYQPVFAPFKAIADLKVKVIFKPLPQKFRPQHRHLPLIMIHQHIPVIEKPFGLKNIRLPVTLTDYIDPGFPCPHSAKGNLSLPVMENLKFASPDIKGPDFIFISAGKTDGRLVRHPFEIRQHCQALISFLKGNISIVEGYGSHCRHPSWPRQVY
jgi:hypothetical protein